MIKIELQTDNDSFQDGNLESEVIQILTELIEDIERQGVRNRKLFDGNGNTVGEVSI